MEDILNKESSITTKQSKQGAAEKQNIAVTLTIEPAHHRNRRRQTRLNQNIKLNSENLNPEDAD